MQLAVDELFTEQEADHAQRNLADLRKQRMRPARHQVEYLRTRERSHYQQQRYPRHVGAPAEFMAAQADQEQQAESEQKVERFEHGRFGV